MKRALFGTRFFIAAAAGLLLPLAFTVAEVRSRSFSDWTAQVALGWLWMATPQLPFIAAGLFSLRLRSALWLPLSALCLLLVAFQAWVQWGSPPADHHLLRMFYPPFALPFVLLVPLLQFGWHRLHKRRTPA